MTTDVATPKSYRILIVDDHSIVRRGLRLLLESQHDLKVCAEAADGSEAMRQVIIEHPDLVVLDLTMPERNGLEVARLIREQSPCISILILTMHFSEEIAREVVRCGARGYILKSDADIELLTAVRHIQQNKPFYTSTLAAEMAESFVCGKGKAGEHAGSDESKLTNREIKIVQLLADGMSNKEIAIKIGVSTRTVEAHRNHVMHKMKFQSVSDLIRFALRNNLVEP